MNNLIETTLGQLPVTELGRINAHDHIIIDGGLTVMKEPDFKLDNVDKAVEEIGRWREAGGGAIVDTQPFGCGRNVDKLIAVSEATGVPIIVPTGFQHGRFYLKDHWQYRYDQNNIADLLLAECTEGVDRNGYDGPIIKRSPVKANMMKVGGEYQFVNENMKKLIRAVGRVHQETAVPVLCHTEMGTACHDLLDLLEAAGVPPHRVILSHVDRNPDFNMHAQWAKRGAFLQYDTPGRIKYQPENLVVDLMRRLFDAGLGSQLTLGGDMARRSYWQAYGGGPGFDYLLTTFTTRLAAEGFTDQELDMIWHENPAQWLCPNNM